MSDAAVGLPLPRVDGYAKVTGAAQYASEADQPGQAWAVLVTSTIGPGRVVSIEPPQPALPGVLAILTHRNAARLPYLEQRGGIDPAVGERLHVLQDDRVRFFGQPIAVVVAETLEQAEHAAAAVQVRYEPATPTVRLDAPGAEPIVAEAATRPGTRVMADYARGDADRALSDARVRVDARYDIGRENHTPMEPHATIAAWDGDHLTLWSKSQWVGNEAAQIAAVFGLPHDHVRVVCPFIGGAFGTTLRTWAHVTVAALAARAVKRPVKLALTRRQMFYNTGHRPRTTQRVALGASADGQLTAIVHEGTGETSRYEQFIEALTGQSTYLYSCPNVRTRYRITPLDIATPNHMRGPGEASGVAALECALDELASALGVDPVELRIRNEPAEDESEGRPFSSRSLVACLKTGAERFGWAARNPRPQSMRDGRLLVGQGVASATYPMLRNAAGARARLRPDGVVEVETAASDMGPGTYTSLTQVAAETLGLPLARVHVRIGQSEFPATPPHGGSQTLASVGSAVQAACTALRARVLTVAAETAGSPLFGLSPEAMVVERGRVAARADAARAQELGEIVQRARRAFIEAEARSQAGDEAARFSMHAFGAIFVEVAVDPDLATVQLRRAVGAYGIGRVVNPRLARSQCIGGMVGGIGMALMEETIVDPRDGRPVNASMADYLVPVNLDLDASLEALFVEEDDRHVNPLGAKGVGEIALIGMAPAIANAVYHATGRRVRRFPIHLEALLDPH